MSIPNRIGVNKKQMNQKSNITDEMNDVEFDIYCAKVYLSKIESCKQRGVEFKLNLTSFKNLLRAKRCYYTGVVLTRGGGQENNPHYLTIDRIDNKKPYQSGNVVACSRQANQLKNEVEKGGMTMRQALSVFKKTIDRGVL